MKRQIETLKRYITHAESMAVVIAMKENKESMLVTAAKQPTKKMQKCPHCKEGEVKTCQMHQKLYHRCQNCKRTWSIAATAT
jgi:uncharacterized protein (DUF983 family)